MSFLYIIPLVLIVYVTMILNIYTTNIIINNRNQQNQQINLTVFVKDSQGVADNAKGDVATIYITITDLNDNNPVFTNPPYTATIPGQ